MKTILLVEDDKFVNKIYKKKLANAGFNVISLENGLEVVETALQEKIDLVILDLVMPKKDGFEVLRDLRALPELKDLKIIILSNLGQKTDVEKARKLGATDYFVKSNISVAKMVEVVKRYAA